MLVTHVFHHLFLGSKEAENMREIMFMREVSLNAPATRESVEPCIDLSTGLFLYGRSPQPARRQLKKNSRNFRVNREMRRKFCVIRPVFGRFLREIDMKLLGEMPAKFQNLFRNRNLDS